MTHLLLRVSLLTLLLPAGLGAQGAEGAEGLLDTIRRGGGWVAIPVVEGSGGLRTDTVPTLGLTLAGCMQVWEGHSGQWTIQARDPVNDGSLDAMARPGEGVPFSYRTGLQSMLDVRVRWSEPRDTTLLLWVGLAGLGGERDPCTPASGGR